MQFDLIILGGGAAGVFAACNASEMNPHMRVLIIEKSGKTMAKIRISGGGRCNVTHACYEPRELVKNYPRGHKELLAGFYHFQPADTIDWFERHGVALKTESDGRIFPVSNKSITIIECLQKVLDEGSVTIAMHKSVKQIQRIETDWVLHTSDDIKYFSKALLIATGSAPSSIEYIKRLGHSIIPQVPSLFTFQIDDERISDLPGLSVNDAHVKIEGTKFEASGPLLITHWGLSGPGILRLSAFAARELAALQYQFTIQIQWNRNFNVESALEHMNEWRHDYSKQLWPSVNPFRLPQRLWISLLRNARILPSKKWSELSKRELNVIAESVCKSHFQVSGKSTFKEEFVTAGGVALNEVDFRTMESKIHAGLYFAGEILDIDGVTGGFNFQAAWTTAYIAAKSICNSMYKVCGEIDH